MTVIALSEIAKTYGEVRALHGVSLTLQRGEVHALLGENGAGKSTLLGDPLGAGAAGSGEIAVDGLPTTLGSPADALAAGIATVYQHFTLVPPMTVAENLRLAVSGDALDRPRRAARPPSPASASRCRSPPRRGNMTVGQRHGWRSPRPCSARPRVLLLDEPTSVLAGAEIDRFLALIRAIADPARRSSWSRTSWTRRWTVADRVTVLRRRQVSGEIELAGIPVVDRYA